MKVVMKMKTFTSLAGRYRLRAVRQRKMEERSQDTGDCMQAQLCRVPRCFIEYLILLDFAGLSTAPSYRHVQI